MVPEAQLYLVNFETDVELGNAIDWLISEGVHIISASWGDMVGGPGDGTGPINKVVNKAVAAGILWVNAAGNDAVNHWGGPWSDSDGDKLHDFTIDKNVNRIQALVPPGAPFAAFLKWDDPFGAPVMTAIYRSSTHILGSGLLHRRTGRTASPILRRL